MKLTKSQQLRQSKKSKKTKEKDNKIVGGLRTLALILLASSMFTVLALTPTQSHASTTTCFTDNYGNTVCTTFGND